MKSGYLPILGSVLLSTLIHLAALSILDRPLASTVEAPIPGTFHIQILSPNPPEKSPFPENRLQSSSPQPSLDTKPPPLLPSSITPKGLPIKKEERGLSHYYETKELDIHPEILADIPIDPPELRNEHAGGTLILKLWIGANGNVDEVRVEKSSLPDIFEKNAVKSFRAAKFKPGKLEGISTASIMLVELNYLPLIKPGAVRITAPPAPLTHIERMPENSSTISPSVRKSPQP